MNAHQPGSVTAGRGTCVQNQYASEQPTPRVRRRGALLLGALEWGGRSLASQPASCGCPGIQTRGTLLSNPGCPPHTPQLRQPQGVLPPPLPPPLPAAPAWSSRSVLGAAQHRRRRVRWAAAPATARHATRLAVPLAVPAADSAAAVVMQPRQPSSSHGRRGHCMWKG